MAIAVITDAKEEVRRCGIKSDWTLGIRTMIGDKDRTFIQVTVAHVQYETRSQT